MIVTVTVSPIPDGPQLIHGNLRMRLRQMTTLEAASMQREVHIQTGGAPV